MERCSGQAWRTASYSGSQGDCVELACADDAVGVRDTKNRTAGHLTLPSTTWTAFVADLWDRATG